MTKEEVLTLIKKTTEELGYVPSLLEVVGKTKITRHAIRSNFVSYRAALVECGLERRGTYRLPLRALFDDWAEVARKLGKAPTVAEYDMHAKYCHGPLVRIYGGWRYVAPGLLFYAKEQGLEDAWKDVLEVLPPQIEPKMGSPCITSSTASRTASTTDRRKLRNDRKVYGAPMARTPLVFEPINEAGVAVLFGAVAHDLGFSILHVQQGFPDCEVMREIEPGRCQREIGEFEFESRNFLAHGHAVDRCDLIICWIHNWPECPLEVIELRSAIKNIG